MSTLTIHALRHALKLGHAAEERAHPQVVEFDISMELDFQDAAKTDELKDTVDYISIIQLVEENTIGREWKLVETLCTDLATAILNAEKRLGAVTVCAKKNVIAQSSGFSATVTLKR